MPSLEDTNRYQDAVLWDLSGRDSYGTPTVSSPIPLLVRWVDKEDETKDPQGNTITIQATVKVDRQIEVGSILWKGHISDLSASPTDLMIVASYSEVPDIKGRNFHRSIGLTFYADTLPAIA